ncbi:ATP-binding protein [Spiroplasma endosymbiont of Cantharis nigra]|uniref:ATP-binding protein n=1 Tax=Spiroplasma endosymbiont of Cantharis nigra TaxID=3066278 RepID=UPI0030D42747
MKTLIKSLKFSGYKAFEKEVLINFETNKNKYNFKESVRDFKTQDGVFHYNNHLGFIGPNASGKTSILTILKLYRVFLEQGVNGLKSGLFNPFTGNLDPITVALNKHDFNKNSDYLKIELELVNEEFIIKHQIKIKNNFKFSEEVDIKKTKNKNMIWENIFKKEFDDDIDFISYSNFINSSSNNNIAKLEKKEETKKIADSLKNLMNGIIFFTSQISSIFWINEFTDFLFSNEANDEIINKMKNFIEVVAKNIDSKIKGVEIKRVIQNQTKTFAFDFILNDNQLIPYYAISEGTWKIIGMFVRLYLLKLNKRNYWYFLFDEIDNSWHPNLTRIFLRLIKSNLFENTVFLLTFHNPYIAEEIRQDSLYLILQNQEVSNWIDQIKIFNEGKNNKTLRLSTNFANKYLDEVICSGPENFKADTIFELFDKE